MNNKPLSKEELLHDLDDGYIVQAEISDVVERHNALKAMSIFARQESIGFFKFYVVRTVGLLHYLKNLPLPLNYEEIDDKIKEFGEGDSIDQLYEKYLESKTREKEK